MALRLRRGTDAERQTITPLEGELIYTTDLKELWVGDGTTAGGILVSAEVSDDTSPQLGGNLDLNGNDITGTGNININGTITASGTVNLGDGAEDNVIVGGQISSSLIPRNNEAYDLGGPTARWNKVYGYNAEFGGAVTVGDLITDGNIVKADSTVIYDAATGDLTVNNINSNDISASSVSATSVTAGSIVGDLQGSVFADDSTLLVDGVNGQITAFEVNITGGVINTPNAFLRINSADALTSTTLQHYSPVPATTEKIDAVVDGNANPGLYVNVGRGTLASPATVQVSDTMYNQYCFAHDGSDYTFATGMLHVVDPNGSVSAGNVPGMIVLGTVNDGDPDALKGIVIDSQGQVTVGRLFTDQARATLDVGGDAIIDGVCDAASFRGSLVFDNSTVVIDAINGSLLVGNVDIVGQTGNTPVDTGSVDSWLEVTVNGATKYIPLYV